MQYYLHSGTGGKNLHRKVITDDAVTTEFVGGNGGTRETRRT